MKGVGRTVMVGTKLEEFQAEVLGVMRDVSPGRDMILCRLSGCNLEHAGIIQGMSGSPIYIDGKLLGAVAFAWEFAKDPIAGVTPFCQMVEYVRSNDRRLAAEARDIGSDRQGAPGQPVLWTRSRLDPTMPGAEASLLPMPVAGGGLAGMRPIASPLATTGFSPRALAFLDERFAPLGMAPMAGGGVFEEILEREGNKPLEPGSPLSVAMVTGDFDMSAIGTVTHVEGNRVYGFGHPMFGLGACEFPMMTGYIHTVYPRASVSMKMGSPLKTVGVLDTDVSTGIAGTLGAKPDMMPMHVKVRTGATPNRATYDVEIVRNPKLLPSLVQAVLANAVDTEGDLPDGVDRPVLRHGPPARATSRSRCGTRSAAPGSPARSAQRPCSARSPTWRASWRTTRSSRCASSRSTARWRSNPAVPRPRSSRSGWRRIGSSRGKRWRSTSPSSRTRGTARF